MNNALNIEKQKGYNRILQYLVKKKDWKNVRYILDKMDKEYKNDLEN